MPGGACSSMAYYRGGGLTTDSKYEDFCSTWTSPYVGGAQDFMGWPPAFCDGDTTDPASDDLEGSCRIPSACSSSSDEGSARRGRFRPQASSVNVKAAKQPVAEREFLPSEGLIDIDPDEGRQRGEEIMAMLMMPQDTTEEAPTTTFSTLSVNAPAFAPPMSAPGQQPQPRQLRQPQPQLQSQLQSQCWSSAWEGCGTAGWSSDASGTPSPTIDDSARQQAAAVQQAAQEAFGPLLKEVVVASDGYMVLLHQSFRQYEQEVSVLTILSRALWPLLGREVVSLEPSVAPRGQHRLALQVSERDSESCWEFATTGSCPRGSRCRWEHRCMSTSTTYIDVVY